jgi:hypothetical protein
MLQTGSSNLRQHNTQEDAGLVSQTGQTAREIKVLNLFTSNF